MSSSQSEMADFLSTMSRRLGRLLYRMRARNVIAVFAHIDADTMRELPAGRVPRTVCLADYGTMRTVEAGVCWRDPAARRVA